MDPHTNPNCENDEMAIWDRKRRDILMRMWNAKYPIVPDIFNALGRVFSVEAIRARLRVEIELGEYAVLRRPQGRTIYFWNDERTAKALALIAEGLTHAEVGERFYRDGKPVGRRAIDNLILRLNRKARKKK